MAETTKFNKLVIGDRFIFKDEIYEKAKPVKLNCCTLKSNAFLVNNPSTTRVFKNHEVIKL